MQTSTQKLISYFGNHGGVVRFSDLLKAGFHPDSLAALTQEKKVERMARGLYRLMDNNLGSQPDLLAALLQAPKGVICLISALSFHEATLEIPHRVDIAIPQKAHANRITYPPVQFYRFDRKTWEAGIEEHEIEGQQLRIYSLAKTIADCFKFRNKIGIDVARDALKVAIRERKAKPLEIMRFAKLCRVDKIIQPILETLL